MKFSDEASRGGTDAGGEPSASSGLLSLHRLTPTLGVEIGGVDASVIRSPALVPFLLGAVLESRIVLIRGLDLDVERFRHLGSALGRLRTVPRGMRRANDLIDVQCLTNLGPDGAPTGYNPDPESLRWHSDGSGTRTPARYTLLYALRVPREGGETIFADTVAVCAALSPAERQELVGRRVAHDPEVARWVRRGTIVVAQRGALGRLWQRARLFARFLVTPVRHPVIRVHEATGRESLFVGDHAWRLTGMRWRDGRRRADQLNEFVVSRPEWTYHHTWQAGDLLVWDNCGVLHRGSLYDASEQQRVILRAVVAGDTAPLAAAT